MPNDIQKLIDEFSKASKIHCDTLTSGDWKMANRQAKKIHKTYLSIKVIGSTARDALLNLVENYDDSIACMAAVYSLTYDENKSKNALQRIAKKSSPVGLMAEQALERWQKSPTEIE